MQKNWRLRQGNDIFHQRWEHLKIVFTCRYAPFVHLSMRLPLHSFACLKCWSYHVPTNMHILTHMVHFTVTTYAFLMKYDMKNMLDVQVLAKKVNFIVKKREKTMNVWQRTYMSIRNVVFFWQHSLSHTHNSLSMFLHCISQSCVCDCINIHTLYRVLLIIYSHQITSESLILYLEILFLFANINMASLNT